MKLFFHEFFIFLCCVLVLYGVAYGTVYTNYQRAPADRYYWGNENFPLDIAGNLSYVRSGFHGHWMSFIKYSSTLPDNKSLLKMEYTVLGQIARVFQLDTLLVFYQARALISLFFLFVTYFIIVRIFRTRAERIVAIILSLFATNITINGWSNQFNTIPINDIMVFARATVSANHYMLAAGCILVSLYFLSRTLDNPQEKKSFMIACVSGFLTSMFYAPDTLIVFTSLPLVFVIKILVYRPFDKQRAIRWVVLLFTYTVFVSLPLVYLFLTPINWKGMVASKNMESLNPFRVDLPNYFLSIGATFLFSLFALPTILKQKNTVLLLFASWIIVHPVGEFIVSDRIGINRIRYFLTPYYVVFGILATVGIFALGRVLGNIHTKLKYVTVIVCTAVTIGLGFHSYKNSQAILTVCFCQFDSYDYSYPKRELMEGIWWLRDNSGEDDIVLSDTFAGVLIPAFAGNRVYTSWWHNLMQDGGYFSIVYPLQGFYYGGLSSQVAETFLRENGISYVFYSENERKMHSTQGDLSYSVLTPVFKSGTTIVYKVNLSDTN